ncbi:MAG: hypothetical protein GPOALKHO_001489 [Sodalis sp.]|nr:MAG: hypothetical protein GPOALKHO_001489 [Sodalis sp.]
MRYLIDLPVCYLFLPLHAHLLRTGELVPPCKGHALGAVICDHNGPYLGAQNKYRVD